MISWMELFTFCLVVIGVIDLVLRVQSANKKK